MIGGQSVVKLRLFSNRYGEQAHKKYIVGFPDGKFKPDRHITRAEIAAIVVRILDKENQVVDKKNYPKDVSSKSWYANSVAIAWQLGLLGGYQDGTFKPDKPISRAELAAVISKLVGVPETPMITAHFSDMSNHWANTVIEEMYRNGILGGYGDGTFKPNTYIKRSEAVTMINRLLYVGELHGTSQSFPDVSNNHWAFKEVEEAAINHHYIRNDDGSEQYKK